MEKSLANIYRKLPKLHIRRLSIDTETDRFDNFFGDILGPGAAKLEVETHQ